MAGGLASALGPAFPTRLRSSLELAGQVHELGRILGPCAGPADLACATAQFLDEMHMDPEAVRGVRHMPERWDGTGGPDGLLGEEIPIQSLVLAIADLLDHRTAAWCVAGLLPAAAAERAIETVAAQSMQRFGPDLTRALERAAVDVRWAAQLFRTPVGGEARERMA
jgi:hypothetical protein